MGLPKFDSDEGAAALERIVDKAKEASDFLKALAHENRLLMLCLLAEGEKSVTELETFLSLRQPTVSQQLARLRMDGLVTTRREGKTIYYSLASEEARKILGVIYEVFCAEATGGPAHRTPAPANETGER